MIHSHLTKSEQTVWLGALASNIRSMKPQLRMDSQNGLHKIMWLSKGSARVMINGVTKGVGPNNFIFVPSKTPHDFEIGLNTFGSFIAIDPKANIRLPSEPFIFPVINIMKQAETAKYVDGVASEALSELPGRYIALEAYVSLLVVHILRLTDDKIENKKETSSEKLMRNFTRILEGQFHTGQTLNEYAEALGVTTTHLSRVSRTLNNKSAGQLVQNRVLCEVSHLLLHSSMRIKDISVELGFTSPAYFTRLFKSKMLQTPKDYRKSRARGPEETMRIRSRDL